MRDVAAWNLGAFDAPAISGPRIRVRMMALLIAIVAIVFWGGLNIWSPTRRLGRPIQASLPVLCPRPKSSIHPAPARGLGSIPHRPRTTAEKFWGSRVCRAATTTSWASLWWIARQRQPFNPRASRLLPCRRGIRSGRHHQSCDADLLISPLGGQRGQVAEGQVAVNSLVDARKLLGPLQGQNPPPCRFRLGRLTCLAMQDRLAKEQLGIVGIERQALGTAQPRRQYRPASGGSGISSQTASA